ncbi:MAG: sialidase family protein, partial [bacterium]
MMGVKAEILERGTVAARPGQMYAWPGIARLKNGEILVSASERTSHICPLGREVVIRSLDGGKSWQLPQEV